MPRLLLRMTCVTCWKVVKDRTVLEGCRRLWKVMQTSMIESGQIARLHPLHGVFCRGDRSGVERLMARGSRAHAVGLERDRVNTV